MIFDIFFQDDVSIRAFVKDMNGLEETSADLRPSCGFPTHFVRVSGYEKKKNSDGSGMVVPPSIPFLLQELSITEAMKAQGVRFDEPE